MSMKKGKSYSISEAAKIVNTTSETLRHYDRIGLVKPSRKDEWTNYRYYTDQDIVRLNTVKLFQLMDLSLEEIRNVLEYDDLEKIISFLERAERKADEKIAALQLGKEKIARAKADYGDMETWGLDSIRGQTSGERDIYTQFTETYFVPYIKTIKNYKITSLKTIGYKNIYKLDGTPDTSLLDTPRYYVILPNGTITGFSLDGHCDASHEDSDGNTVCDSQWYYTDIYIVTDINGKKAPNTLGKDIFVMSTMDNQFGFYRYKGLESNREWLLKACSKGSKENRHCGRLIQYDGWEIKDDYPW